MNQQRATVGIKIFLFLLYMSKTLQDVCKKLKTVSMKYWIGSPLFCFRFFCTMCSQHSLSGVWLNSAVFLPVFLTSCLVLMLTCNICKIPFGKIHRFTCDVMWRLSTILFFSPLSFPLTSAVFLSSVAWVTCCRNSQHTFCMHVHFWPRRHLYVNMSPPIQLCSQFRQSN